MPSTVTIASVTEDYGGRSSTLSEDGTRTCQRQRRFQVVCDLSAATSGDRAKIESAVEVSLPVSLYQAHPAYGWCLARTVTLQPNEDFARWTATVGYSSAPFPANRSGLTGDDVGDGGTSPSGSQNKDAAADARPPEINFKRKEYSKVFEHDDVNNKDVKNSAGDPFDPPVEVERSRLQVEVSFFRLPSALNWAARSALWDCVNASSFKLLGRTFPAKTLRVMDISAKTVWDKGSSGALTLFWQITVLLEHKPDTWQIVLQDSGYRAWKTGMSHSLPPVPISDDKTGDKADHPLPLDGSGGLLAPGSPYQYLTFDAYTPASFTTLFA